MATSTKTLNLKIIFIARCVLFLTVIIILRLFHLQIVTHQQYQVQSTKNFLRNRHVAPLRGTIIDRTGIILATNLPTVHIFWQGSGKKQLTAMQKQLLERVCSILNMSPEQRQAMITSIARAERLWQKIIIARNIGNAQVFQIAEQIPQESNIGIDYDFKRYYPHNELASHVIGYLNRLNAHDGIMGLEKILNADLQGQPGLKIVTIDAIGRALHEQEIHQPLAGKTIVSTIELPLQQIGHDVFPHTYHGCLIVMDPADGAVRALISAPEFNPNMFLQPLAQKDWQELQTENALLNRACSACYPPGSIFKLVTAAAILDQKLIPLDHECHCCGYVTFAQRRYWCNNRAGHGWMNIAQAIAHSCNPLFFSVARHLPIDILADYAHRFGLGNPTGIQAPERTGLVPDSAWKRATFNQPWWPGETLSAAIGQSYLLVTPLQIARMIGGIFTKKLMHPRLDCAQEISWEPLQIPSAYLSILQHAMQEAAMLGTARSLKRLKNMTIYAKTSTAQTSALEKRGLGGKYLEHAWFTAYVVPADSKPFVLVIVLEHAGSSGLATEVAKRFLQQYNAYITTT